MQFTRRLLPFVVVCLLLASCSLPESNNAGSSSSTPTDTKTPTTGATTTGSPSAPVVDNSPLVCPAQLGNYPDCQTPRSMRMAYGVESLMQRGFTGKGQTVVDIVSFGSPTLQQDMDVFDRQFNLPSVKLQVIAPIGTKP